MSERQHIVTPDVSIELPPDWVARPSEEGMEFVSPDETEQLILSVSSFEQPQTPDQIQAVVSATIATRQRSVETVSQGRGQLLPVRYEEGPTTGVALVGADVSNGVLIYVRIIASSTKLATISCYRYRDAQDVAGFVKAAEPLCQSLRFVTH